MSSMVSGLERFEILVCVFKVLKSLSKSDPACPHVMPLASRCKVARLGRVGPRESENRS